MKLRAAQLAKKNFGDDLNFWLWPRLFGDIFDDAPDVNFIGIGSVLGKHLERVQGQKVVFGAGYGYSTPPKLDASWKIYFCRGPLTAKALNLDATSYITDGAYALGLLPRAQEEKMYDVSLILHSRSEDELAWQKIANNLGLHFISHELGVDAFMREVARSKRIISEAMHGAIVADIFRIPWKPVYFSDFFLPLKWQDWCGSLGIGFEPVRLPPVRQTEISRKEFARRSVKKALSIAGVGKFGWRNAAPFMSSGKNLDQLRNALLQAKSDDASFRLSDDETFVTVMNRIQDKTETFRKEFVYKD